MFKALIVEDNALFRHSLNGILSARFPFMSISEAANGEDAMDMVAGLQPDLVFMDIKLPDGNGLILTKIIRAFHGDTIVIVITAHDIPEYRQAAMASGASYFIPKGELSGDEILAVVDRIVSGHQASPRLHQG